MCQELVELRLSVCLEQAKLCQNREKEDDESDDARMAVAQQEGTIAAIRHGCVEQTLKPDGEGDPCQAGIPEVRHTQSASSCCLIAQEPHSQENHHENHTQGLAPPCVESQSCYV